ncbi:CRISPR-associated helicase Cas3' [Shimazuella alba]|uniref:CRISPR-associated helicase Cas3 n=1 Tax=Shimazuella alba TaxID=2690964 RepID=A0A6I4VST4_9BACL|nr:CRISPR-associated helicase Cas3' [Shimazuella alba]MXQ54799.1 CRISPR-associated helicase Cas3' [Shimazuella alba]
MDSIAHIRKKDKQVQTVEQHLLEAKELAEEYGEKLGIRHVTGLAGLLHDLGKYTTQFRDYIFKAVHHPDYAPRRGSVDHSTAGGRLLYEYFHKPDQPFYMMLAEIVGNAIFSHHSYLKDFITPDLESDFLKRAEKPLDEFEQTKQRFFDQVMDVQTFQVYVGRAVDELETFLRSKSVFSFEKKMSFLTKFVFSALIDADRTNTCLFEEQQTTVHFINSQSLWSVYYDRLMLEIQSFANDTKINKLRNYLSEQCEDFAAKSSGIYTLSIPTGGGKTLTSLRYALKHAKLHHKQRILYILPYTTIIEQNAATVRDILQDPANILEHHSNVIIDEKDDEQKDGVTDALTLSKDNWDSPIIFTTIVQFLNVFYAYGTRNIRRLHQLSNAVLIFDEVQKVPTHCISLFNEALNFLKTYARASIVLCTATQPALDFVEQKLDINSDGELVKQLPAIVEAFKRVNIVDNATEKSWSSEQLADFVFERMKHVDSVLVILNTKTVVKRLYELLKDQSLDIPIFHLSTAMCAAHRKDILEQMRDYLDQKKKVICISSQLVEAGVDISFSCVIRSLAGLDSIAQAAGRCNRHGERVIGDVYIIDHEEENLNHNSLKEIRIGKEVAKRILIDRKQRQVAHDDLLSPRSMNRYFQEFYEELKNDLNYSIDVQGSKKEMTELLFASRTTSSYYNSYRNEKKVAFPLVLPHSYGTAAKHFRVIDNQTTSVIVPYGDGSDIIAELSGGSTIDRLSQWLQRAQTYTVELFEYEKQQLMQNGGIISYDDKIFVLKDAAYNKSYGVDVQNDTVSGSLFG